MRVMTGEVTIAAAEADAGSATDRLGALFDAHHLRLYKLARRMSDGADDARDLVQETFLRAARAAHAIPDGGTAEEAWLVRVLINLCRDRWRRAVTRQRFEHLRDAAAASGSDPESALIARTVVWRALRALPPRQRAIVVMYELEGGTVEGVARLLGVTRATVRWHLSIGRRRMAKLIGSR
jgi:RNA polymerase sigma-70 factor (ECF subfamily)